MRAHPADERVAVLVGQRDVPNRLAIKITVIVNYGDSVLAIGDGGGQVIRVRIAGALPETVREGATVTVGWAPGDESVDRLYERNVEEHRAIRQALAAGSAAGARTLAREHVLSSFELLTTILDHVGADWAKA